MTATADQFVDLLMSQDGDRYIFGHEVSLSDTDPDAFDCSELVQWGCAQLQVRPVMPDGSWFQVTHCRDEGTLISVDAAIATRGALLFRFGGGSPFVGVRPTSAHVAVSQGNGLTIEARSARFGVYQGPTSARGWTHAGLVPGLTYGEGDDMPTAEQIAHAVWAHPLKRWGDFVDQGVAPAGDLLGQAHANAWAAVKQTTRQALRAGGFDAGEIADMIIDELDEDGARAIADRLQEILAD